MKNDFCGASALVMGLGLHGGGLEAAKFLAKRGAHLTVTDLRNADVLSPSIAALDNFMRDASLPPVRYVLGTHNIDDFKNADLVLKNPGVRPDSPFLQAARRIESDISLFLSENPARLTAITGSKGKSFTSSAISWGLKGSYLGGNITVSPLSFLDKLKPCDDVVLELSSWQLSDLFLGEKNAADFKPRVAVITAIMSDHQDRYGSMDAYVNDKRLIYKNQDDSCATVALNDDYGRSFLRESKARALPCAADGNLLGAGGWFKDGASYARGKIGILDKGKEAKIVEGDVRTPGIHQKINLLQAAVALLELGLEPDFIKKTLSEFPGVEHRLELFLEKNGVRFYNDTAATIPEAAAAAISALKNVILVTGGTDKMLDFSPLVSAAKKAKKIILLAGTASDKLILLFKKENIKYCGPFDKLDLAVSAALENLTQGDSVLLSPGSASFGMFLNEFDRGRKWKAAIKNATKDAIENGY
jgi:UDP-N-acetylmuramoylalanine--D-glutamate ligase